MLEIVTFNIEGISPYLKHLCEENEEEKGELSLSGHENSHIRLKNWKKMKNL